MLKRSMAVAALVLGCSSAGWAGPIIIGGDDLNDHGSRSGNTNVLGWLYIQNALAGIDAQVTRPGAYTADVAVVGAAQPAGFPSFDAGGAAASATNVLGLTTQYFNGAAALTNLFSGLAAGTLNFGTLYFVGTDTGNSIDTSEGAVLTANAAQINNFVASGGGLLAHGGANVVGQGWLTTLLPGIVLSTACDSDPGATLTPAGQAAFPTLTNADINAGPCHGSYSGNFGGLVPLALDAASRPFIIGGVGGSVTDPGPNPGPNPGVPEPASLALLGLGLLGAFRNAARKRQAS